jgi:Zn finger protein HypA/HybF involved in hydrogenase expression
MITNYIIYKVQLMCMAMTNSEAGKLGYIASADKHKSRYLNMRELYENNPNSCSYCGKALPYESRMNKYCNHSCCASFNNIGVCRNKINRTIGQSLPENKSNSRIIYMCKWCKKILHRKSSFCNSKCFNLYNTEEMIKNGTMTYNYKRAMKSYLIETRRHRCENCKLSKWRELPIPLELHHIDGDVNNMELMNLQLLCPNCHSITVNYRSKNRHKNTNRKHERM